MPGGVFTEGEPFGNEATAFIKEQIMQKEVEIEVETMDKGGIFLVFTQGYSKSMDGFQGVFFVATKLIYC